MTSAGGGAAGESGRGAQAIVDAVQLDLAHSTQTVVYAMAGIMAAAFLVAAVLMPRGRAAEEPTGPAAVPERGPPA